MLKNIILQRTLLSRIKTTHLDIVWSAYIVQTCELAIKPAANDETKEAQLA